MSYKDYNTEENNRYNIEPPARHSPYGNTSQAPNQPMVPRLPTGVPTGPSPTPGLQMPLVTPMVPPGEQSPQTLQSPMYTPGYLRSQIGKTMRVEFLMGSGPLVDRIGTLVGVGASYILLRPVGTDDILLCDIYSIKFVTILSRGFEHL